MWMLELLLACAVFCGAFFGAVYGGYGVYNRCGQRGKDVIGVGLVIAFLAVFVAGSITN